MITKNTPKNKIAKKWLWFFVCLILAGLAVAGVLLLIDKNREINKSEQIEISEPKTNYSEATDEQKLAGQEAKKNFLEKTGDLDSTQSNQSSLSEASVVLTSYSRDTNSGNMYVKAMVSGPTSVGSCTVKILNSKGETVSEKTANTVEVRGYYICDGFEFDKSPESGEIVISYADNNGYKGSTKESY